MEHILYLDGNLTDISWVIETKESIVSQKRKHVEDYKNKITIIQSKYIGLHVALFWGIGTFNIKNEDQVTVKLDEKIIYQQLKNEDKIEDELSLELVFLEYVVLNFKLFSRKYFERLNFKSLFELTIEFKFSSYSAEIFE